MTWLSGNNDKDHSFLLMPGVKIDAYDNGSYGGSFYSHENYTNFPKIMSSMRTNHASSIRAWYNNFEINFPGLS